MRTAEAAVDGQLTDLLRGGLHDDLVRDHRFAAFGRYDAWYPGPREVLDRGPVRDARPEPQRRLRRAGRVVPAVEHHLDPRRAVLRDPLADHADRRGVAPAAVHDPDR